MKSVTIKASIIAGIFAIVAAVIGSLIIISNSENKPNVSATTSGDSSPAIAISGDVRESNIVINQPAQKQTGVISNPVIKSQSVFLLDSPGGNEVATIYGGTPIEVRERKGPYVEVVVNGFVYRSGLKETFIPHTTPRYTLPVWENPFGWHDTYNLDWQPSNFRIGVLNTNATVELIGNIRDEKVNFLRLRVIGWVLATDIGGQPDYQKRLNGSIHEWLTDGKSAIRVSDVLDGTGTKAYFQVANPQSQEIAIREVQVIMFDVKGGLTSRIRPISNKNFELLKPGQLWAIDLDSDLHPVEPTGIEIKVFFNDNSQSGPYIVTWSSSVVGNHEF